MRFRQVLDDVEQDNDIDATGLPQVFLIRGSLQDVQAHAPGVVGGVLRQFDARSLEKTSGLRQKEPIGASQYSRSFPSERKRRMNSTLRANSRRSTCSAPR